MVSGLFALAAFPAQAQLSSAEALTLRKIQESGVVSVGYRSLIRLRLHRRPALPGRGVDAGHHQAAVIDLNTGLKYGGADKRRGGTVAGIN